MLLSGIFTVIFILVEGKDIFDRDEPKCNIYSRFDWEDKLLQKVVESDFNLKQHMTRLEGAMKDISGHNEAFQEWQRRTAAESEDVRSKVGEKLDELRDWKSHLERVTLETSTLISTTYVRWGRTVCPGNGSEAVYDGYAGGSHYSHSGAAASMLCLPKDPDWDGGKFSDAANQNVGYIYGTEYEDASARSDQLFGENHQNQDVPCVVCDVRKRSSVLMVPGKTKCHPGWTFEYSGYLMAGYHSHHATDYYCVDKNPENLPTETGDNNGRLLYFVEAICGSLRCPPYVDRREFQCVVCSK